MHPHPRQFLLLLILLIAAFALQAQPATPLDTLLKKADDPGRLPESVILLFNEQLPRYSNPAELAWIHDRLATAFNQTGVLDSSAVHSWTVLQLDPGNEVLAARAYFNLGDIAYRKGAMARASEFFERAFRTYQMLNDQPGQFASLLFSARVNYFLSRPTESLEDYRIARLLAADLKDTVSRNIITFEMARVLRDANRYSESEVNLLSALKSAGRDTVRRIAVLEQMGKLFETKGEALRALDAYKEVRQLQQLTSNPLPGYQDLARVYARLNRLDTAAQFADSAEIADLRSGDTQKLRECYKLRFQLAARMGDTTSAYIFHIKFQQYSDSVQRREAAKQVQGVRDELILGAHEASVRNAELMTRARELDIQRQRQSMYLLWTIGGVGMLAILLVVAWLYSRNFLAQKVTEKEKELAGLATQKEKLFTVIAHDLQVPLATFGNLSRSLSSEAGKRGDPEMKGLLLQLHKSSAEVMQSLTQLVDWSVAQSGTLPFRPELFNCHQLASSVEAQLRPLAEEKGLKIEFLVPDAVNAYADRTMVAVVLRTLLYNAIRFSAEGRPVTIFSGRKDDLITIGVKDNGKGISPDRLRQLFLWSKDTQSSGSRGIGLPLCRDLVARNGGNLYAESKVGEGSTFYFSLPEHPPMG
jgi:signal transduction histidine kinase